MPTFVLSCVISIGEDHIWIGDRLVSLFIFVFPIMSSAQKDLLELLPAYLLTGCTSHACHFPRTRVFIMRSLNHLFSPWIYPEHQEAYWHLETGHKHLLNNQMSECGNGWIPGILNWSYSNVFFFLTIKKKKFGCRFLACGILGPWLAIRPASPLQWKHGVLTTDCQGSPVACFSIHSSHESESSGAKAWDSAHSQSHANDSGHKARGILSGAREETVHEQWVTEQLVLRQCVGVLQMLSHVYNRWILTEAKGEHYPCFTVEKPSSWILWNTAAEVTQLVTHGWPLGPWPIVTKRNTLLLINGTILKPNTPHLHWNSSRFWIPQTLGKTSLILILGIRSPVHEEQPKANMW